MKHKKSTQKSDYYAPKQFLLMGMLLLGYQIFEIKVAALITDIFFNVDRCSLADLFVFECQGRYTLSMWITYGLLASSFLLYLLVFSFHVYEKYQKKG